MAKSQAADLLNLLHRILKEVSFDYSQCAVKGRMSPTWQTRIPAIFLSLARLTPGDPVEVAPGHQFYSSKETIIFFNDNWSNLVFKGIGKKDVSVGNYDDFRDHGIIPLVENGFAIRNTSVRTKNLNGKDTAYQVTPEAVRLLQTIDAPDWPQALQDFMDARALRDGNAGSTRLRVIPSNDSAFTLHEDKHNWLQQQIIEKMLVRFAPTNRLIYAADTEERSTFFNAELVAEIGIGQLFSEKKPDVVAYDPNRDWIFIVEAVTSTGHINHGRKEFFLRMLSDNRGKAVFVTAFPDRDTFRKFASDMAWETEVWLASEPDHMIHFDGERFLGPYT